MNKLLFAVVLGTSTLGLVACGAGGSGSTIGSSRQALEALIPLQGCGEVDDYVRGRMIAAVNKQVDQAIKSINENQYGSCYRGGGGGGYTDAGAATPAPSAGSSPSGGNSGGSSSGGFGASEGDSSSGGKATQTSGTNNQVANVDEADFVKNDGQYLYIVANGALRILRAFPANIAGQVAKIPIEGTPKKLFVEGDRAVVYVSMTPTSPGTTDGNGWSKPYYGSSECTYGYECVPRGDGTSTQILVYDIANRAAPQLLRTIKASGSLLSARRIGNAVHTVLVDPAATLTTLQSYPTNMPSCDDSDSDLEYRAKQIAAWEELRTKNLAAIAAAPVQSILPSFTDNDAPAVAECSGYFRPSLEEGRSFTSLLSIDIAGGPSTTATVVSDPGVTYASETGLYLSVPHQQQADAYGGFGSWYGGMEEEKEASTVHKFRIGATPSLTGYEASGVVKGRVLNQFALDEHEGHLRIATTTGHAPSDGAYSTMSVLQRQDKSLVLTGKVDKIAPSEDIRSVRFDGSRGYIVTFKKTDPLYVFDLGNPGAPAITGELKIPGFSTYMHMMDASHLLTIGYDAADQGDFAYFTGVMLQIFDVSDMKHPTLAHKEVIGTRGSSSEALTNHLAFNYFAPKNLLALPMTICEGGSQNGGFGTNMTFSGLMVYDTTAASGFHLRGKVSHPHTQSGGYDSSACSNWWTQASSEVKRSVIMDDWVYSISEKRVKINALADLGADIAELSLTD